MRIGVFLTYSDDLCAQIRRMRSLGFTCGQLNDGCGPRGLPDSIDRDETVRSIRETCEETGFEITAVFAGWSGYSSYAYPEMYRTLGLVPGYLRAERTKDILDGAAFAKKLGVKNVFTHIGFVRDDPGDPEHVEIVQTVRLIADRLRDEGQDFQIETGEMLPVTLLQLIHDTGCGNLGVNFDPANFLINGRADPSDALDMLLPFIRGVHAKDAVYPVYPSPKGKETPLGGGRVDFPYLVRRLKEYGYQGDLTIEREITGEEQIQDILRGAEYLRTFL